MCTHKNETINVLMTFSLEEKERIEKYVGYQIDDEEVLNMTLNNIIEECLGASET